MAPRARLLTLLLLAAFLALARGAPVAAQAPAGVTVPALPDPAAVSLDASTTAFLALDFNNSTCANLPACVATLPAVATAITAARAASVLVVYSSGGSPGSSGTPLLPDVLQGPNDPLVVSGADKFYGTNLDDILKQHGITTVVLTGTFTNGAILYTAFAAAERGYAVVVAEDGVSARGDVATPATEWLLLNSPGTSNPQNTPLQAKAVTLSRTDLITYTCGMSHSDAWQPLTDLVAAPC